VIVERSMSDQWLSNTYVVADELGDDGPARSAPPVGYAYPWPVL